MTRYISTRGHTPECDFVTAMMTGLCPDGGLYVPKTIPQLMVDVKGLSYQDTAFHVLSLLAGDAIPHDVLRALISAAYTPRPDGFDTPLVTPLHKLDDHLSILELYHGPTMAFKDVALQLLGQLFDWQLKKNQSTMTIIGATSGDTGSAAIEGCRHAAGADIYILYPHNRTSEVQRRQMTTVNAPNVHALAIDGSFDDCQAIVKTLFSDIQLRTHTPLSAVNSINWARIAAQIVYYVHTAYSYDEPVNFIVPTGNFGNVYAAYMAKKMGAPIKKLIITSNKNDILPRFLNTGKMQTKQVEPSLSPSMDIQISSNFERLLFDLTDHDPNAVTNFMTMFKDDGTYTLDDNMLKPMRDLFLSHTASDANTLKAIKTTYDKYGYVIDPHTATGLHGYYGLKLSGPVVALACAHPAKFPDAVTAAIGFCPPLPDAHKNLMTAPEKYDVLPKRADAVKQYIMQNLKS